MVKLFAEHFEAIEHYADYDLPIKKPNLVCRTQVHFVLFHFQIIYINQLTKEAYEYVKGDLKGAANLHEKRSEKLISQLLSSYENKKSEDQCTKL